jgi:toxin CcdB
MPQFDVYRLRGDARLWVDVQTDLLDIIGTRVIVPLERRADAPPPVRRLNPVFVVDGAEVVLLPQLIVAVPVGALGKPVARLDAEADAIREALDMLLSGF